MKTKQLMEIPFGGTIYGAFLYYSDNKSVCDSYDVIGRGVNFSKITAEQRLAYGLDNATWVDLNRVVKAKIAAKEGRLG